jgi:hypothetical protein
MNVRRQRGKWLAVLGLTAVSALTVGALARASSPPNACTLLGVTTKLAVEVYGGGASIGSSPTQGGTPPNLGATCALNQGSVAHGKHFIGGIYAEPYAASEYATLLSKYSSGHAKTRVKGLGSNGWWIPASDPSAYVIVFERGKIAVLLLSIEAGGVAASDYPTEQMYLKVAQGIYKHLH